MIGIKVFNSIRDVPSDWDGLHAGRSLMQSRSFWQLVEDVGLNDVQCRYLLAYNVQNEPIALCACYLITTDIAIFAGTRLRSMLCRIRRWWPGFLQLKTLECGTPVTINPPVIIRPGQTAQPIIDPLNRELVRMARAERALVIVVRDFETDEQDQLDAFVRQGYHKVDNLPNTYLDIRWPTAAAYQAAMKSYYRSKLRRMLRKNQDRDIRHRMVDDFGDLSEALSAQWATVSEQASEYQREFLSPEFYRRFSESFGRNSKVMLFYRGAEWIAHALLLVDGVTLRWLYFGRTHPANDGLYIYVANAVVETAIELGLESVEMGLTTYAIKKDLGARMVQTRMAIKSPWRPIHPFVGLVYRLLNRPPRIANRQVFKGPPGDA